MENTESEKMSKNKTKTGIAGNGKNRRQKQCTYFF